MINADFTAIAIKFLELRLVESGKIRDGNVGVLFLFDFFLADVSIRSTLLILKRTVYYYIIGAL